MSHTYTSHRNMHLLIFQVYSYKAYEKHGFLLPHADSGKLTIDTSKTLDVLDEFAECYERLLGYMDTKDGAGLEAILWDMAPENDFVRGVLRLIETPGE